MSTAELPASYISVKDAAAKLKVSKEAVRRYILSGILPYKRKNQRALLVLESAVDDLKYDWDHPKCQSTA